MVMRRSTLGRAFQTFAGQGPAGPRALLVAVIGRAALDLAAGDVAAARFFLSKDYRHYLELIGLSADYLPAGVTHAELLKMTSSTTRPRECRKMPQNVALQQGATNGA